MPLDPELLARAKMAAEKRAIDPSTLAALGLVGGLGATGAAGAAMAPPGHRMEGGYRALSRLGGIVPPVLAGGLIGGSLGSLHSPALGWLGAAGGAAGGGLAGNAMWDWSMPQPTWERGHQPRHGPHFHDDDHDQDDQTSKAASLGTVLGQAAARYATRT